MYTRLSPATLALQPLPAGQRAHFDRLITSLDPDVAYFEPGGKRTAYGSLRAHALVKRPEEGPQENWVQTFREESICVDHTGTVLMRATSHGDGVACYREAGSGIDLGFAQVIAPQVIQYLGAQGNLLGVALFSTYCVWMWDATGEPTSIRCSFTTELRGITLALWDVFDLFYGDSTWSGWIG